MRETRGNDLAALVFVALARLSSQLRANAHRVAPSRRARTRQAQKKICR